MKKERRRRSLMIKLKNTSIWFPSLHLLLRSSSQQISGDVGAIGRAAHISWPVWSGGRAQHLSELFLFTSDLEFNSLTPVFSPPSPSPPYFYSPAEEHFTPQMHHSHNVAADGTQWWGEPYREGHMGQMQWCPGLSCCSPGSWLITGILSTSCSTFRRDLPSHPL